MAFGVLILVLGILGASSAWAVVDTKMAANSAAREAARSYVESDGSVTAWAEAVTQGRAAWAGVGRDPVLLEIPRPTTAFDRCGPFTVTVSSSLELPRIPGIRAVARRVRIRASHTEVVDPYRAGLARTNAICG